MLYMFIIKILLILDGYVFNALIVGIKQYFLYLLSSTFQSIDVNLEVHFA